MTHKEMKLCIHFLNQMLEQSFNCACNDVDDSVWDGWTKEERQAFVKESHEWNGDPEEYDPDRLAMLDFEIAGFLVAKLIKEKLGG